LEALGAALGAVSKARCDTALERYFFQATEKERNSTFFITSAGMARRSRFPAQTIPLGHMQREYMSDRITKLLSPMTEAEEAWRKYHLHSPIADQCYWNTRSEIMNALRFVQDHLFRCFQFRIVLVTSDYHARRAEHIILPHELKRAGIDKSCVEIETFTVNDGTTTSKWWEYLKTINEYMRNFNPRKERKWRTTQPLISPF
jgi:hypothetical protein